MTCATQRVSLSTALELHSKQTCDRVDDIVDKIARVPVPIWGRFADALRNEFLVTRECWNEVIGVLASATTADKALLEKLKLTFRRFVLHGPAAEIDPGCHQEVLLGRATSAARFFRGLEDFLGSLPADHFVEGLNRFEREGPKPSKPFGDHCIWATFNERLPTQLDPWDQVPRNAGSVRAFLAIDDPSPVVRFRYRLRNDRHHLKVPTLIEGYSGDTWGEFAPSPSDKGAFGRTRGGAPEVVHSPEAAYYQNVVGKGRVVPVRTHMDGFFGRRRGET